MEYIKLFSTEAEQDAFIASSNYAEPHVSWCEDKKKVKYNKIEEEEEPETISFNVDFFEDDEESQYSAIAGMTWEAWIASEYNRGFQVEGTLIRSNNGGYMQYDTTGSRPVYKHESIIASKLYYVGSIEEEEEPEPEEE